MRRRPRDSSERTPAELVALLAEVEADANRLHSARPQSHGRYVRETLAEHGTGVVECYRARWLLRHRPGDAALGRNWQGGEGERGVGATPTLAPGTVADQSVAGRCLGHNLANTCVPVERSALP